MSDYATDVEWSSSLSLPQFFCSRVVLRFHPCLVLVLYTDLQAHPYLWLIFTETFDLLFYVYLVVSEKVTV